MLCCAVEASEDTRREAFLRDMLNNILKANRPTPSVMNRQPWHFIVIIDQDIEEKLSTGI